MTNVDDMMHVLELGVALDKMARTIPDHPTKANLLKYAETFDDAAKTLRRIAETMRCASNSRL